MKKEIIYLNITSFPLAIERVLDLSLRERPVAIAPLSSDRAVLWEVSPEAKDFGIRKGMPSAQARRLCKDLKIIAPRPDFYHRVNQQIEEKIISKMTPVYEIEKPGHIYLDMTGTQRLLGQISDVAFSIQKDVEKSFRLSPSIGSSKNKMVSKVAAKSASPFKEIFQIKEGTESDFLAPLPITVLPVIREMAKKSSDTSFDDLNLKTVSDILNLNFYALEIAFGKNAGLVFEMARGIDQTPLYPTSRENIIFEESYLREDTNDLVVLRNTLSHHLERATFKMRKEGIYAQRVRVSLRYSDYKFVSKEKKLKKESNNTQDFSPIVFEIFQKIFTRRTRVIFLSLEFLHLKTSEIQLLLFEEKKQHPVIDEIKERFGEKIFLIRKEIA